MPRRVFVWLDPCLTGWMSLTRSAAAPARSRVAGCMSDWLDLADEVRRRLGPGVPLGSAERASFEGQLGGDLSRVMVHRSPLAGHLARVVDADALTADSHVLGDPSALDASTPHGLSLLGHELAHVVQRDVSEAGEAIAQRVEEDVAEAVAPDSGASAASRAVDTEALAERVYRRMLDELRRDRERGAWFS
jgi:hypothetical protein